MTNLHFSIIKATLWTLHKVFVFIAVRLIKFFLLSLVVWKLVELTLPMAYVDDVWVGVEVYSLPHRPWECESFRLILCYLLCNLQLEFFQFLFNLVINMSNIMQKVITVVFLLFLRVEDVLPILSNVVDATLYHSCISYVLWEGFPSVDVAFSGDHWAIQVILLGVLALFGLERLAIE